MTNSVQVPSFDEETLLMAKGYRHIAGIDEAGRGALAGPVVAAAVILPCSARIKWISQVRDSKLLTPAKRELLCQLIREKATAVGVGVVPHTVIDTQGIVKATRLAMKMAVEQLAPEPEALLIDYLLLHEVKLPQKAVVDGDSLCFSIASASIVAKVARDHIMVELDKTYHGYGLAQHKGYGTEEHIACLHRVGPSLIHRLSFQPVKDLMGNET